MDGTTATTGSAPTRLTMAEIDEAIQKMRGIPPAKWLLMSPNGSIWTDTDPMKLAHILAGVALGIGPIEIGKSMGGVHDGSGS